MAAVRFGVVGLGIIGMQHAGILASGAVKGAALGGLCTHQQARLEEAGGKFPGVRLFASYEEMLAARNCDAVLIATPHTEHARMAREAFAAGLHVLVEKPLAVTIAAAREVVAEYG